jgi:peptidyl-tRNA hydrolase, PTH1 family
MKLLVGLGNPGAKYAGHRHNVGFMAVEHIAARFAFGPWRQKFQGYVSEGEISGDKIVLLKPETFMNESGRAVQAAAQFLKLEDKDIIVLHDELDLLPGKVRVKVGGGNAGHNGLRSIAACRSAETVRVRIGIGHPGSKDAVLHWVLNDFSKSDKIWLDPLLEAIAASTPYLIAGSNERFMSDVARLTGETPDAGPPKKTSATVPAAKVRGTPHPAGDRVNKQQNALVEKLRKWALTRK